MPGRPLPGGRAVASPRQMRGLRRPGFSSIAERKRATAAQIALAWLLAQKPWIVPTPATTKLKRLEENIGAVDVELSAEDLDEIERAASEIRIQGERYPEVLETRTGI